ncbi:MAG: hypothetical protein MUO37_08635 [Methyloceanibacter sp.]|nr:hypothetical protein [Methyloceanibacter sp.]
MQRPDGRLIVGLLGGGAISCLAGLAANWLAALMPCQGEGLACNIDTAVGAYAVLIFAVLGPIIFGVTLLVAQSRRALAGAAVVLLTPILGFYLLAKSDSWRYVGFYPYKDLRTFLVMFAPPLLVMLVQYLILRLVVPRAVERPQ